MKYLSIGLGILAVLLVLSVLGSLWVAGSAEEARAALDDALAALDRGDFAAAISHGNDADALWARNQNRFSVLVSHETLNEISVGFAALRAYATAQAVDEYRAHCCELSLRLSHLARTDLPFYYNFL